MSSSLQPYFDRFLEDITLGQTQVERIESAARTLKKYLCSRYDLAESNLFLQGSYANGTAVKPVEGGEYDVDIVCICATESDTAADALTDLYDTLANHGTYADHLVLKEPCVRIEYADDYIGGFHVDVVPVRPSSDERAPLEAPRRSSGWHLTAPIEYTAWCADQGEQFITTVKMLKRWRDEHQEVRNAIKSIVLQVLIARHIPDIADDDRLIGETLANLHAALDPLSTPPPVWNPVLHDENLAARWDDTAFRNFKRELAEAVQLSQKALGTDDVVEAAETWREVFGDAFPLPTKDLFGVRLADTSHAEPLQGRGWYEAPDSRYRVSVIATEQRGKRGKASRYPNDGPLLFAGKKLRFTAHYDAPSPVEIWWRVTNTGEHARSVDGGLRGKFFKAKRLKGTPSPDPAENWEDTAYTGSHLVEVFLVSGARVVARSEPFKVNIYKKGRRWAW